MYAYIKESLDTMLCGLKVTAFAVLLLAGACSIVFAYPTVTVPTATMVPDKSLYLDYYGVDTRATNPYAPDRMGIAASYIGLTRNLELDVTNVKPESVDGQTTLGSQYLLLTENRTRPAFVVGAEDMTQQNDNTSFYFALAKNVTPFKNGRPVYPLVRLNLGYGTSPRSALFGGVQIRVNAAIGLAALSDGHDGVYCLSYYVPKTGLNIKCGALGRARFVGLEYRFDLK